MASALLLPQGTANPQWSVQSSDVGPLEDCSGSEFFDNDECSILYSPRFGSRWSSFDFDQAMDEYANSEWFCHGDDDLSDSQSVLDDHFGDSELMDSFQTSNEAFKVDPRSTLSLPVDALRSYMDDTEVDFIPPMKRCETATRYMLRQMQCGEGVLPEDGPNEDVEGQSVTVAQKTAFPVRRANGSCRKSLAKLNIASFRALLVPFKKK